MCGICGVYSYNGSEPISGDVIGDMLSIIHHRGPDDEGTYIERDIALGMRRLSIIDPAGGKQPIRNEDGAVVVVFNGEIYNYRELTAQLQRRGHRFATVSDTEVIVHLYEEAGEECVKQLRGMFSFALWDDRRRQLLIARDRLGIKPIYYAQCGGCLVFGSEIKALLRHPALQASLDLEGLGHFLSLKYVPAPRTMFAGIRALPPGRILVCDRNGPRVRPYWQLSFAHHTDAHCREDAYAEQLEALLRESVKLHLVSDVPFGAFLSGGIDSSTIVALMSQLLDRPIKTFSVGFDGDGKSFSELPYARLVAKRYGTDHHEICIRGQDLVELAEKVVWHLDQPIADDATVANYMVAKLAAHHVKMVLTGEGGDELFGGYARHAGDKLAPLFSHMPAAAKTLAQACVARLPGLRRPKIALYALCQTNEAARLASWFPLFNPEMKSALLTEDVKAALNGSSAEHLFAAHLARTDATGPLNRMLYLDTALWLPDDLLARGDKTSMGASLEARVPLLDYKLVEFAAKLPTHLKVRGLTRKYLLKQVARRWLPPEIVHRSKKGFPVPVSLWFRKEARTLVRDVLSPSSLRRRGLFNPHYVQTLLDENDTGFADHGSLLWALLNVELWHQLFLDSPSRARRSA